jgi:DNA-binding NarL/FixJ family response regulator
MRLILLGPAVELEVIQQVIGAGAKGYLTLDARETEVAECLEVVRDGGIWAPRKVLARLIAEGPHGAIPVSRFTGREDQVLHLLLEGKPNREIAADLGIDEGTVKAHVSRLMRKVGVGNRTALTMAVLQMRKSNPAM